jgi:hypothetical protein
MRENLELQVMQRQVFPPDFENQCRLYLEKVPFLTLH